MSLKKETSYRWGRRRVLTITNIGPLDFVWNKFFDNVKCCREEADVYLTVYTSVADPSHFDVVSDPESHIWILESTFGNSRSGSRSGQMQWIRMTDPNPQRWYISYKRTHISHVGRWSLVLFSQLVYQPACCFECQIQNQIYCLHIVVLQSLILLEQHVIVQNAPNSLPMLRRSQILGMHWELSQYIFLLSNLNQRPLNGFWNVLQCKRVSGVNSDSFEIGCLPFALP